MAITERRNISAAAIGMGIALALAPLQRAHADGNPATDRPAAQFPSPTITGNKGDVCGNNIYAEKGSTVTVKCHEKEVKQNKKQIRAPRLPAVDCKTYVEESTVSTTYYNGAEYSVVHFKGHLVNTGIFASAGIDVAREMAWKMDPNIKRIGPEDCIPKQQPPPYYAYNPPQQYQAPPQSAYPPQVAAYPPVGVTGFNGVYPPVAVTGFVSPYAYGYPPGVTGFNGAFFGPQVSGFIGFGGGRVFRHR